MKPKEPLEPYLQEKRNEIIFSLADTQGYNGAQIARLFNMSKSRVSEIIKSKPSDWKDKWVKA